MLDLHRRREPDPRLVLRPSLLQGGADGLGCHVRTGRGSLVEQYDVRTPGIHVPVSTLSGGNQQKVIVAREFDRDVRLVIASQPTRGIDVGSIEYIHDQIVAKRDAGAAVLVVSSELDEVLALSDRILVLFHGKIAGEFSPDADITDIGLAMLGAS